MSGKLVVLISGNGSNLQAIIDACQKDLPAEVSAVISNDPDAFGLQRATKAGIPTHVINHRDYTDRAEFDHALRQIIDQYKPDFVILAGFMRKLTPEFVAHYPKRMLNIHPSLLPKYRGLHTHERVLEAGDKEHGVTIHFVTDELDGGPIIAQEKIAVTSDDTAESLKEKIHVIEHRLYPQVIAELIKENFAQPK